MREDFSVEISIKDSDWSINQSFFPLIILFLHSWQPEHKLTMHNGNLGGKYWPLPTGCPRELAIFFPYPIDIKYFFWRSEDWIYVVYAEIVV